MVIDAEGTVEKEIECILEHKGTKKPREYKVKFIGQQDAEAQWMTKEDLSNARELIREYESGLRRGSLSQNGASVT